VADDAGERRLGLSEEAGVGVGVARNVRKSVISAGSGGSAAASSKAAESTAIDRRRSPIAA
jgi:hypothetical protein